MTGTAHLPATHLSRTATPKVVARGRPADAGWTAVTAVLAGWAYRRARDAEFR